MFAPALAVQNADDAGSREFKVLLDLREFAFQDKRDEAKLLSQGQTHSLAESQGRALYQYNDAEFRAEDYASI